jgi:hypothetical protein
VALKKRGVSVRHPTTVLSAGSELLALGTSEQRKRFHEQFG